MSKWSWLWMKQFYCWDKYLKLHHYCCKALSSVMKDNQKNKKDFEDKNRLTGYFVKINSRIRLQKQWKLDRNLNNYLRRKQQLFNLSSPFGWILHHQKIVVDGVTSVFPWNKDHLLKIYSSLSRKNSSNKPNSEKRIFFRKNSCQN